VILADSSIWIDYLRGNQLVMAQLLDAELITTHPFVVAEVALGSLKNRRKTLAFLESLEQMHVARLYEVRQMIEARTLYSKGIGLTDAHLIASCLITPGVQLWTRDARLRQVAVDLSIDASLP
jgi:predicted nucleic acid-binding protein